MDPLQNPNYRRLHGITLSVEEGQAFMDGATYRLVPCHDGKAWGIKPGNRLDIKYKRRWLDVCRTDLLDDIQTGVLDTRSQEEWIRYYRAKIRCGVRVGRTTFAVIDAITDG